MRIHLRHHSLYRFPSPAALGPHLVRLRPAPHAKARVEHYALHVPPEAMVRWQQDPFGNHVAHLSFRRGARLPALEVLVELALDVSPVNPFDFFLDDRCEQVPFAYPAELRRDLAPFLDVADPAFATGPRFEALLASLPADGPTVGFVGAVNAAVHGAVRYVIREEAGLWTPEETLERGCGSCRDQAVLLIALLRRRGLAARFASGYLVQVADEGLLPDEPRGVSRDVADLHAWGEVFLPGGGWRGLDPTSGLFAGEGHVPLAAVAHPALGAPIEGTADQAALEVSFRMEVGRLGHEARPTAPFDDGAWAALLEGSDRADAALAEAGLALTSGGEPTLNSREHAGAPEWNGEALGPTKWLAGLRLAAELRRRMVPGAAVLSRPGKWYPGESLPRWALELVGHADGRVLWPDREATAGRPGLAEARRLAAALCEALGVPAASAQEAFEDPWRLVVDEAGLPVGVDPLRAELRDPEARRRLARLLGGDPGAPVGLALPLARGDRGWVTERWRFRREHLFLVPGDSPMGLRLPLAALGGPPEVVPEEAALPAPDPRLAEQERLQARRLREGQAPPPTWGAAVRTAVCVEPRDGALFVFLPPVARAADFVALVEAVDAARAATGLAVQLEGYPPPASPALRRLAVTPDPGVLEVNLPP